jgi:general secretion pathway protein I
MSNVWKIMYILKTVSDIKGCLHNETGFTLLEVIVSVAIIAVLFVSIFRLQSGTINLAAAGKFNIVAPLLAEKVMVQVERDLADWSETSGDFGDEYPGYQWECEISDAAFDRIDFIDAENLKRFKEIRITVHSSSGKRSLEITSWRMSDE